MALRRLLLPIRGLEATAENSDGWRRLPTVRSSFYRKMRSRRSTYNADHQRQRQQFAAPSTAASA